MINKLTLKKIFALFLIIIISFTSFAYAAEIDMDTPCIVIHAGEYPGKDGKRSYLAKDIDNLDKDIYVTENGGSELGEFYLNKPICQKIAKYIREGDPKIKVIEFYSKDRSTDLNAAGRKAVSYNPDLYLSIHHNCTDKKKDKVSGYICMTAAGNYSSKSEKIAQNIAKTLKSVSDETGLPQFSGFSDGNWKDNTYVGELNETNRFCPAVLIEIGFFNNIHDLNITTNKDKIDLIAKAIALSILKDFHSGKFDNDQYGEKNQDSTMKGAEKITLTNPKKQIEVDDDKDKNIKERPSTTKKMSSVEWLKQKVHNYSGNNNSLNPISRIGPRTNSGRNKINSILNN